jgi:hypothetical protein
MYRESEIWETARRQFCLDCNCEWEKEEEENKKTGQIFIAETRNHSGARICEGKDLFFRAIIYHGNAYIMADRKILGWAKDKFSACIPEWFCSYSNLRMIDEKLREFGRKIADTHLYFLPCRMEKTEPFFEVKWFEKEQIREMKGKNSFHHALGYSSTQPDVLAVAALIDGKIAAMAGASEDGKYMWQIGVDVLKEFRGRGLAVCLTSMIKQEILKREKIPFYGTSESHSISQNVAIRAGFRPAWAEIYTERD